MFNRICGILRTVSVGISFHLWPTGWAFQCTGFERGGGWAILNIAIGPIAFTASARDDVIQGEVHRREWEALQEVTRQEPRP